MMSGQYDNTNRGALFTNDKQGNDKRPDLGGSINVDGRDYWISGWYKTGAKGDFVSLSIKAKDAVAEGHPDRFRKLQPEPAQRATPVNRQRPTERPSVTASLGKDLRHLDGDDDSIPF